MNLFFELLRGQQFVLRNKWRSRHEGCAASTSAATRLWNHSARRFACGGLVVRWIEDHAPAKSFAVTFGARVWMIAQSEVDNSPLARGHRSEVERSSRLAHFFGGHRGGHAQFFEPQGALILAVEGNLLVDRKSTRLNSSHRTISYA